MTDEETREIARRHVDAVFVPEHFDDEATFETYKSAAFFAARRAMDEAAARARALAVQEAAGALEYQAEMATENGADSRVVEGIMLSHRVVRLLDPSEEERGAPKARTGE